MPIQWGWLVFCNMIYMRKIHLKLDNDVFEEMENLTKRKNLDRNSFIYEALEYYIKLEKRKILAERIMVEADMVKEDSMRVLREFDRLDR
jgi:hypothetical protein